MRRLSKIILPVGAYTLVSEVVNQYLTLLGLSQGLHESDPIARYLFSISVVLETIVMFALPVGLLVILYRVGLKWTPSTPRRMQIRKTIIAACLILLILLAISTTLAAISDYYTVYGYL